MSHSKASANPILGVRPTPCSKLVLLCLALLGCERQEALPENYGVYVRSGNKLVDLTDNNSDDDFGLSGGGWEVIVHHRDLKNPTFSPEENLALVRVGSQKATIEYWVDSASEETLAEINALDQIGNAVDASAVDEGGSLVPLGEEPIPVRFKPLGDSGEMLAITPETELEKGSYWFVRRTPTTAELHAFGLGVKEVSCIHEHAFTVAKQEEAFSWQNWFEDLDKLMNQVPADRMLNGRRVVAAYFAPCEESLAVMTAWEERVSEGLKTAQLRIDNGKPAVPPLTRASDHIRRLEALGADTENLVRKLVDLHVGAGRKAIENGYHTVALHHARLASEHLPNDDRVHALQTEAERLQAEAEALLAAKIAELKRTWKTQTKEHSRTALRWYGCGAAPRETTITDVSIIGAASGHGYPKPTTVWFADIKDVGYSSNTIRVDLRNKLYGRAYLTLCILERLGDRGSTEEFGKTLEQVWAAWLSRYAAAIGEN